MGAGGLLAAEPTDGKLWAAGHTVVVHVLLYIVHVLQHMDYDCVAGCNIALLRPHPMRTQQSYVCEGNSQQVMHSRQRLAIACLRLCLHHHHC